MPTTPVPPEELRWTCPPSALPFRTTADLPTDHRVVGQATAAEALRFGLSIDAPGHNVYVRGAPGTGRRTLTLEVLQDLVPTTEPPGDRVFVYNFAEPNQPRLLTLPPGDGPLLREQAEALTRFVLEELAQLVDSDSLRARVRKVEAATNQRMGHITSPFEASLSEAGLSLVGIESEEGSKPAILPVVEGQVMPFEELRSAQTDEDASAHIEALEAKAEEMLVEFGRISSQLTAVRRESHAVVQQLVQEETQSLLEDLYGHVAERFAAAETWIEEVFDDVCAHVESFSDTPALAERYRVNVLRTAAAEAPRAVVVENAPTVQRLLGGVDVGERGGSEAPHLGIHAGALVKADGGTLVLDAREVLSEPGAWGALKRALRSGTIELTPQEASASTLRAPHLRPSAIPFRAKVVLIGGADVWASLDHQDPDFPHLFKVLVDLDSLIHRDAACIAMYSQMVARLVTKESLPPFTAAAVAGLVEHGARVASQEGRLTARFGRIADLAREAAFLARQRGAEEVDGGDVTETIDAGKRRADLPGRRFRERIASGMVQIETTGTRQGQVNGLAVVRAGPLSYGFPMRITATVGAGQDGAVHLQREAMLSGQIHTKGFLTVKGLLRHLLSVDHPLAFDASITHEQSYGGVDGDSASAAEFVCLMSALTGLPARQGLAITGAIDQHGNVLPVGAVDEKIEGFFDATAAQESADGIHGVIVPEVGVGDLQLRPDVVEACRAGRFQVFAVRRIEQALELLLEQAPDAVVARAVERAGELWRASTP
ncbi:MAG: AAA family ATPase [Myxococcales bacterium]|nr:AAA family ATPase [Myxococcales bacterium]